MIASALRCMIEAALPPFLRMLLQVGIPADDADRKRLTVCVSSQVSRFGSEQLCCVAPQLACLCQAWDEPA